MNTHKYIMRLAAFCARHASLARIAPFVANRKGITGLVIGMVVVLIACAVLIPVGVLVASNLQTAMPALSGSANTTAYAVYNNVYSAFQLSAVVPIVAAAGVIISIIVGVFAFRRAQGGQ